MLGNIKLCFVYGIHNLIDLMVDFRLCIYGQMNGHIIIINILNNV